MKWDHPSVSLFTAASLTHTHARMHTHTHTHTHTQTLTKAQRTVTHAGPITWFSRQWPSWSSLCFSCNPNSLHQETGGQTKPCQSSSAKIHQPGKVFSRLQTCIGSNCRQQYLVTFLHHCTCYMYLCLWTLAEIVEVPSAMYYLWVSTCLCCRIMWYTRYIVTIFDPRCQTRKWYTTMYLQQLYRKRQLCVRLTGNIGWLVFLANVNIALPFDRTVLQQQT